MKTVLSNTNSFFTCSSFAKNEPAILFGGTWLLEEFFRTVARFNNCGKLVVISPYIGDGIGGRIAELMNGTSNEIDLSILTQNDVNVQAAKKEFEKIQWRSIIISECSGLHAKIYIYISDKGGGIALIGSHNMTLPGMEQNSEAGVLFYSPNCSNDVETRIQECYEYYLALTGNSKVVFDNIKWPQFSVLVK